MNISTAPLENRQLSVTIEADPARVQQELRKAARKLGKEYRIPGFRKGKAPFNIIAQYVGLPNIYAEFADDLGQELYREALELNEFEPYGQAALENIDLEPLTYKLVVPLEPEVQLNGYRDIRLEQTEATVDEAEVEARLAEYQTEFSTWQDVDRPAAYGDTMSIDVRSVLVPENADESTDEGEDEAETVVLNEEAWDVTPDEENPMDPPGFDEQLVGMKAGDSAQFELAWPEDSQSIYAGRRAQFSVTVHGVQAFEQAALNDELAQLVGPDFETLDDLQRDVRETLQGEAQQRLENEYLEQVLDAFVEEASLNYPPIVIEDQIDAMVNDFTMRLRQIGMGDLETFFQYTGQTLEGYREELRGQAPPLAERNLVISEMLNLEEIEVSDEEFEARLDEMVGEPEAEDEEAVESAQQMREMLRAEGGRPLIESQLLREKAVDRMLAIARGEDVPAPKPKREESEDVSEQIAPEPTAAVHGEADQNEESESDDSEQPPSEEASGESTGHQSPAEAFPPPGTSPNQEDEEGAGAGNNSAPEPTAAVHGEADQNEESESDDSEQPPSEEASGESTGHQSPAEAFPPPGTSPNQEGEEGAGAGDDSEPEPTAAVHGVA